jgi:alkylation response protein AidB-like acyl-CoA dehydrogenase
VIGPLFLHPLPAEAEALRGEVREFLDHALADMAPDRRARSWLGSDPAFSRALAARGWIGLQLPRAYGGGGREPSRASCWWRNCWPPVRRCRALDRRPPERAADPEVRHRGAEAVLPAKNLPRRGFFCIGMSEPNAGSDLASVGTRATPL